MNSEKVTVSSYDHSRVVNWEQNSEILKSICCIICFNIPKSPIECSTCSSIMCQECHDQFYHEVYNGIGLGIRGKYRSECPLRCSFPSFNCPTSIIRVLNTIHIKCVNHSNGCNATTLYDRIEHHEKDCEFKELQCAAYLKCRTTTLKKHLEDHENSCKYYLLECIYCSQDFERAKLQGHQKKCPKKIEHCEYCNNLFFLEEMEYHVREDCSKAPLKCGYCRAEYIREEKKNHNCISHLAEIMDVKVLGCKKTNSAKGKSKAGTIEPEKPLKYQLGQLFRVVERMKKDAENQKKNNKEMKREISLLKKRKCSHGDQILQEVLKPKKGINLKKLKKLEQKKSLKKEHEIDSESSNFLLYEVEEKTQEEALAE